MNNGALFGSKAEVLADIGKLQSQSFVVPDLVYFGVGEWAAQRETVLRRLTGRFGGRLVAVRSSAWNEDGNEESLAGFFHSRLHVNPEDGAELAAAIDAVVASYHGNGKDQVLVQAMISDVAVSGVALTRDLDDGAPYLVISYDDDSGRTDTITGGTGVHKTVMVHRGCDQHHISSPRIRAIVRGVRELEAIFGDVPIDIEFALSREGTLYIFQVRRIATRGKWASGLDQSVTDRVGQVIAFVRDYARPVPTLLGNTTVLGNMPDWNPAEMIGVAPRPLAASLYREFITRDIWRLARESMGYRPLAASELMVLVAGRPYIDVRASFNSFLPDGLEDAAGRDLVDAWVGRLVNAPELHDRVEFEVATTIRDFSFDSDFHGRYPGLLSAAAFDAYRTALGTLTKRCVRIDPDGSLASAENAIAMLRRRQSAVDPPIPDRPLALLAHVRHLSDDCRRFGTLSFSVLARHGFIAEALMRSAVRRGAIGADRIAAFKRTVRTVAGDLAGDMRAVLEGRQSREEFMSRYGHLRPGTYDILSPRYAARGDLFADCHLPDSETHVEPFVPTNREERALATLLREAGFDSFVPADMFEYARRAIQGREYAKFVFSWNVSAVLEALARWGSLLAMERDDVSFLTLDEILATGLVSPPRHGTDRIADLVRASRSEWTSNRAVKLSYLIRTESDVLVVPLHRSAPNFITTRNIEGNIVHLDDADTITNVHDRIVCIASADPGFDWLFAKGIRGLITQYGGANSHMAIRCAEFGLPAAIGIGEETFKRIVKAKAARLNCGTRIVGPLYDHHGP